MIKMSRFLSAGILLMLSLEAALLVAGDEYTSTIRLPSDTEGLAVAAAAGARPWKCCDTAGCTKSIPPICRCGDEVDKCAATCKSCVASTKNPSRYVCEDQYVGDPGPKCRPWACCDVAACTKSIPPICRCLDEVERCAATCKRCAASPSHSFLFVCKDQYVGDPGPICRPWECCDAAPCTKSIPPICHCRDEVEQCAATCKDCAASTSDPSRLVCNDTYRGNPGPKCTVAGGGNY